MTARATRGSGWRKGVLANLKRRGVAVLLPIFFLAIASAGGTSQAESTSAAAGLIATVYDNWTDQFNGFNEAPPLPPTTPVCATLTYPRLEAYFDSEPVCNLWDDFVVKFEGYITAPETGTYTFYMHGDDGTKLFLDGELVSDYWYDTGDGGQIFEYQMTAGQSVALLGWYYENGGGAWVRLEYVNSAVAWEVVPESWFSPDVPPTTTTTTTTTTTLPPTTTTTTSTTLPMPMITTTVPETTTTTSPPVETTSTTTTTEPPVATTTQVAPPQTTVPVTSTTSTTSTTTTTSTTVPVAEEEKSPPPSASVIASIATAEKLAELVTNSDLKDIEPEQAVALVTNPVFTQLETEQLEQVFESIPVSELSAEQEAALVSALAEAPAEVKATFESTVDVYSSGLDDYVPNGSNIDVGTRRSVIAVTTVLSTAAAAGAAPGASNAGGSGPSSGPSSGGSGGGNDPNSAARREDEEQEDEEAGGLEGPEDREKNTNTKNSIYSYGENGMKKFSVLGFIKKFMKETAALSFTLAGSAIMFVTLSGDTRRIAIIATAAALAVHYIHVMLENDEE